MPEPSPRPRFRATVHYDGTAYHGWQVQPGQRTVQGDLEACLERLFTTSVRVDAAGRTDAGVHAVAQEIAFPAPEGWDGAEMHRALDAVAPGEIWVERLSPAEPAFHPRFDATGRRYEYLLGVNRSARSPLWRHRLWAVRDGVDEASLAKAAARLPGERSFEAFAKSGQPELGTRCRVEEALWDRTLSGDLRFRIVADRFLHHMVRYLVSTLVDVATGRRDPVEMEALLAARDDVRPPTPAPPWGLYLTGVRYADGWNRLPGIPGFPPGSPDDPDAGEDGSPHRTRAEESPFRHQDEGPWRATR